MVVEEATGEKKEVEERGLSLVVFFFIFIFFSFSSASRDWSPRSEEKGEPRFVSSLSFRFAMSDVVGECFR